MPSVHIYAIQPARAIPGGRVTLLGSDFSTDGPTLPEVSVSGKAGRVVFAAPRRLSFLVPGELAEAGTAAVRVGDGRHEPVFVEIAAPIATVLHQVDNPAVDRKGNLYLTYSGTRG